MPRDTTPTHLIKMKSRDTSVSDSSTVGVGWMNDKGGISLSLNKGVFLSWRDLADHIIMIWPNLPKEEPTNVSQARKKHVRNHPPGPSDKPSSV